MQTSAQSKAYFEWIVYCIEWKKRNVIAKVEKKKKEIQLENWFASHCFLEERSSKRGDEYMGSQCILCPTMLSSDLGYRHGAGKVKCSHVQWRRMEKLEKWQKFVSEKR